MIKSQQTYECDSCHAQFDSPRRISRIKVQWELQWEAEVVDLCEKCAEPVAAVMSDLNVRRVNA